MSLSAEMTTRLTAISIADLDSAEQLTTLFALNQEGKIPVNKFSQLRRLSIRLDTGKATGTTTFYDLMKAISASPIQQGLQSLEVRLGVTGLLWSVKSSPGPQFGSNMALSSVTSLALETEWLFSHADLDLSPLVVLFPALQTFTLNVKMSLCDSCPTVFACAGALLYPVSLGKR